MPTFEPDEDLTTVQNVPPFPVPVATDHTHNAVQLLGFAAVATSGSYADLINAPAPYSLPTATVLTLGGVKQGDNIHIAPDGTISSLSGGVSSVAGKQGDVLLDYADISGLATVASSGDFNELSNKPTAASLNAVSVHSLGVAGGVATLDMNSKLPFNQIPSAALNVVESPTFAGFPLTGEQSKIYVDQSTDFTYRWSGVAYTPLKTSVGTSDSVPEGATNKYFTTTRASAAAPVQSVAGRQGDVVLSHTDVAGLSTVAVSGSYVDLTDKPASYNLPIATGSVLGGVKQGANISIAADGTISSLSGGVHTVAGKQGDVVLVPADIQGLAAVAVSGDFNDLINVPPVNVPVATTTAVGVIKVGANLSIALDGTLSALTGGVHSVAGKFGDVLLETGDVAGLAAVSTSGDYADLINVPAAYSLPTATATRLGGVKQGANITIASDGTISSTGGGGGGGGAVSSVAGRTGDVLLYASDINDLATVAISGSYTDLSDKPTATALGAIPLTAKGVANGVASLDATGKLPTNQLPESVVGGMVYQGVWNAATNTPTLTSSVGTKGSYYKVNVAGNTVLDGNGNWVVNDMVTFNGMTWDKISGGSSEVSSVAGRIGAVVLSILDIQGGAPLASPVFTGTVTAPTFVGALTGNASTATVAASLVGGVAGGVHYQVSSGLSAITPAGTAGQVLTSSGAGAPVWANVSTGSADANTLTGTTLAANVVNSSLTSVGTLTSLTVSGAINGPGTGLTGTAASLSIGGTAAKLAGGVAGSLPYQSAVNTTLMLAPGTAGQVLTSNGAGAPSWAAPSVVANAETLSGMFLAPNVLSSSLTSVGTLSSLNVGGGVTGATFAGAGTGLTGTANALSIGGTAARATNVVGGVAGGIVYQTGPNATAVTAAGTAGQVLTSNGAGAPTWANPTATAAANALTGTTLAANVVSSSLTSVGTLTSLSVTGTASAGSFSGAGTGLTGTASALNIGGNAATATNATAATTATNVAGGVAGAVPYQTAAGLTGFSAAGTAGQVLTSNGANAPVWAAPSVAASALTGTTLAAAVVASSLTSVGTLTSLAVTGNITMGGLDVGTKIIQQVSKSTDYTLVLTDSGKHIFHPLADTNARVWTIPANSAVAYPIGTAITFVNQRGAGAVTIACGDALYKVGNDTPGSFILAANGQATALKITATEWQISGVNLT